MNTPDKSGSRDWMHDLRSVVADAQALLDAAGVGGGDVARQVHERVTEEINRVRTALNELEADASRYVKDNPWQSLGLAAAVGLLVGLIVARRR